MNYEQVIAHIQDIINNHQMVNEVGVGNISDINYPKDGQSPDYPYAFINPNNLILNKSTTSFNFNLIIMSQCIDNIDNIIKMQSDMIQILSDIYTNILSTLNNPYIQINDNININPFKERFSDVVVGASATITITYIKNLDKCRLPIL